VKPELRARYRNLFNAYDDGAAQLMFVTNHRRNAGPYEQIQQSPVEALHLDDLIQHLIDDIDGAMPRTPPLTLTGIHSVLSPDQKDTEVPTSIIFAKIIDFIRYMQADPYDLLFMRNVRVAISPNKSPVNRDIRQTFRKSPRDFAFSNNGITMLCEKHPFDPGSKELILENPRVVNGSQTLHSIRDVPNPSPNARVMVRIIQIPPPRGDDLPEKAEYRRDIITKIAVRSNQQNPIKKWDLVCNDEFQLEIYRYFRQKNLFYERREREWRQRSRELRSVGINQGPGIKKLTQLIASFYWDKKKLGPAAARQSAGELFEGDAYDLIKDTPPELAYQTYLIGENLQECLRTLSNSKRYIYYLKKHVYLTLFALIAKKLGTCGAGWGEQSLTELLEEQWKEWEYYEPRWRRLAKAGVDHIQAQYKKEASRIRRKEGYDLTHGNYFKSPTYVGKLLGAPSPGTLRKFARQVLR
jgi:AIPR protein